MGKEQHNKEVAQMESWPRTVSLSIAERLWLFNILPKEGDITSLRLLRELKELLNTTDEEEEKYEIRTIQGGVQINPIWLEDAKAAETARDFSIGRKAWELVKSALVQLSTQKKLSVNCIELYDKFTDEVRYAPKSKSEGDRSSVREVTREQVSHAVGN